MVVVLILFKSTLLGVSNKDKDYIIKATAYNEKIKVIGIDAKNVVNERRSYYEASPTAIAALGRTISATLMLGSMQESGESIAVNVFGDGPVGEIMALANNVGLISDYIYNPKTDYKLNDKGKLDVSSTIGEGHIDINSYKQDGEKTNVSFPIISGELGDDLSYYFAEKEGIPSVVALSELIDTDYSVLESGGFIIHVVQDLSADELSEIEYKLNHMEPLSSLLSNGKSIESIIEYVVGPLDDIERNYISRIK
jgi:molecular chaperone Hsp33